MIALLIAITSMAHGHTKDVSADPISVTFYTPTANVTCKQFSSNYGCNITTYIMCNDGKRQWTVPSSYFTTAKMCDEKQKGEKYDPKIWEEKK